MALKRFSWCVWVLCVKVDDVNIFLNIEVKLIGKPFVTSEEDKIFCNDEVSIFITHLFGLLNIV